MALNIEVSKGDLEQTLQVVRPTTGTQDIYAHYLFRVREDKVEVISSVRRVSSKSVLVGASFSGADEFSAFTVDAKSLDSLLKSVDDGTITFKFEGSTVTVTSSEWGSDMDFESLDTSKFPTWDDLYAKSTETYKVDAERLSKVLTFGKGFVLPEAEENTRPDLCVMEAVDGVLQAHNGRGTAMLVAMPEMAQAKYRVHVGTLGPLLKFLGSFDPKEEVTVRNGADKATFYVRGDGAVFGESMFTKGIQPLKVDRTTDPTFTWAFSKDKFNSAVKFLSSGASPEDNRLKFSGGATGNPVTLAMKAKANGKEKSVQVPTTTTAGEPEKLGDDSITFSYVALQKLLDTFPGPVATLGFTLKGKKGFVVAKNSVGTDDFYTLTVGLG